MCFDSNSSVPLVKNFTFSCWAAARRKSCEDAQENVYCKTFALLEVFSDSDTLILFKTRTIHVIPLLKLVFWMSVYLMHGCM